MVQEGALSGAEFESPIHDLYAQLVQVYELGGQHEQVLALYDELERLTPKHS